jgi:hypothetical protein
MSIFVNKEINGLIEEPAIEDVIADLEAYAI